jgi:hypothetical protein
LRAHLDAEIGGEADDFSEGVVDLRDELWWWGEESGERSEDLAAD